MALDLFSLPKERRDVLRDVYFNRYVDKKGPDDCWLWTSSKLNGYGRFVKRFGKKNYAWQAHQAAWIFHYNAPIPKGLICCHSCDNPPCTNPTHIFIGTMKHNIKDSMLKGRFYKNRDPWGHKKRAAKKKQLT